MTKKIIAGATVGATVLAIVIGKNMMTVPAYKVLRVIDGDTFETTEKQLIRLTYADAPEKGRCGYEEAKKELEKLVMNKSVYLKVMYRDRYMRLDSLVYTKEGFVNLKMVESGKARYTANAKTSKESEIIKLAYERNNQDKRGIFGEPCTQEKNREKPKCVIKGNVRGNDKYYHYPGCGQYNNTVVQLYMGDEWFCTEAEAVKAGFKKGPLCP